MLQLIQWPDPRLQQTTEPIDLTTADLQEVQSNLFRMMQIMSEENTGVGLAASQAGWMVRAFVMQAQEGDYTRNRAFINPDIIDTRGDLVLDWEGCLSAKAAQEVPVARWPEIEIQWDEISEEGEVESKAGVFYDLNARIIQHEIDHLNGRMYWHRLPAEQRKVLLRAAYPKKAPPKMSKDETLAKRRAAKKRRKKRK